ncbi:hypothetical protein INQ10_23720, partial [Escherichia coli]|nr:hypothetical protein [Escherichia coli]
AAAGAGDPAEPGSDAGCTGLSGCAKAVCGRCATRERGAAPGGGGGATSQCGTAGCGRADGAGAESDHATGGKARPDGGAGAELRTA